MDKSESNSLVKENLNLSAIQEFYKGKVVFVTGGTGFLGKLLVHKLIR
jgi:FlaA1/EpsC-like NDP-sugar epimerase